MTTVRQLIEMLEEQAAVHGDSTEVRLMTQQSWPFENAIAGVTATSQFPRSEDDEPEDDTTTTIFVVEGRQIGYGTKAAWDCI